MKEKQYDRLIEVRKNKGVTKLGLMTNQTWNDDPKRLVFYLSRYKFVSRMLEGAESVLEIGCGDAFASRIVSKVVKQLTVSDFDPEFLDEIRQRHENSRDFRILEFDPLKNATSEKYNAIYLLDVVEHSRQSEDELPISNLHSSLIENGILLIGTPSLESQIYASTQSKEGHVNCKSAKQWKVLLKSHFPVVLQFGMNDEVVHTGFDHMCHYLFFVCVK